MTSDSFNGLGISRRKVLAMSGVAMTGALAGCSDVEQVESLPRPYKGNVDADVVVEVFEDFSCPHCKDYVENQFENAVQPFIDDDEILYLHYDYPVVNNLSWRSAQVARAVQFYVDEYTGENFSESANAFWDAHELLYANQDNVTNAYSDILQEAGVEQGRVEQIMSEVRESKFRPPVSNDYSSGQEIGVSGTPTFLVNNQFVARGDLRQTIENEI